MRTTYWLVAVAAVAAAGLTVYARLRASDPPVPKVPLTAEPPRDVPELKLPPVVIPPDEPLGLPEIPGKPEPVAAPLAPKPDALPPVVPVSAQEPPIARATPAAPAVPVVPVIPPVAPRVPEPPAPPVASPRVEPLPVIPPVAPIPVGDVAPPSRTEPPKPELPVPVPPVAPPAVVPPVVARPAPLPEVAPAPPLVPSPETPKSESQPLPTPKSVLQPPVTPAPGPAVESGTKFVILQDDKLIEGSSVALNNDTVVVRQGALDRAFPKSQVQFVASSKDEVYKFMLAKVPATDAAARLQVAKWCMFSGMREQALAEAHEVKKLQPTSTAAADMIRSLEASLKQFPPANAPKMTPPEAPAFPAELRQTPPPIPPSVDPEPDVTPEAALVFGSRVQPFLVNQCVECHAKADHESKFKLTRVPAADAGPLATKANLRAVASQLKKDDPGASPLLVKTLAAHGGMKRPAVADRTATAYQALEAWTVLAVGGVKPMPAPAAPTLPAPVPPVSPSDPDLLPTPLPAPAPTPVSPRPPSQPLPAPLPVPEVDPVPPPVPPAVDPLPAPLPPVTTPAPAPLPRPVSPSPATPTPGPLPVSPPIPAVEPLAPSLPPSPPVTAPALPGGYGKPLPTVPAPASPIVPAAPPTLPAVPLPIPAPVAPPVQPGASVKPLPAPVSPVAPGAKPVASPARPAAPDAKQGPKFGEAAPPKKPAAGPAGDEFDPDAFNKGK